MSEELRALPANDRDALAVLALAYTPVSLAEWRTMLARTGVSPSPQTMTRLCERGVRKGLLEERVGPKRRLYATTAAQALEHLGDAEVRGRLRVLDRAVREHRSSSGSRRYGGPERGWDVAGSALRVALIRGETDEVARALGAAPRTDRDERGEWLALTLGVDPPEETWFDRLGDDGALYLSTLARGAVDLLWPMAPSTQVRAAATPDTRALAGRYFAMVGRDEDALALRAISAEDRFAIALSAAFWAGRRSQAREIGLEAMDALGKRGAPRPLRGAEGALFALSRVVAAHETPSEWEALASMIEARPPRRGDHSPAYTCLTQLCQVATGRPLDEAALRHASGAFGALQEDGWVSPFVAGLVHAWLEVEAPDPGLVQALDGWRARATENGYGPLGAELEALVGSLRGRAAPAETLAAAYRPRQPWEVALDSLASIAEAPEAEPARADVRVAWELTLDDDQVEIRARLLEGERAKRGRPVALARLMDGGVPLTEADRRVLHHARYEEPTAFSRRRATKPTLGPRALLGLIDHPRVMEPDGRPLRISRGRPGVSVRSTGHGLTLALSPESMREAEIAWEEQSPGHLVVYERTEPVERIARVLARGRVEIPERGRERLGEVLARLGERLPVDASGEVPIEGEERAADPRPMVILEYAGGRLSVRVRVAPLGVDGPKLRAGVGDPRVASIVEGEALRALRDLPDEVARRDELFDLCPTLAALGGERDQRRTDALEEALEVLLELAALGDEVVLAWPRGVRLAAPTLRRESQLRVRVRSAADWLHVDAALPVDEERVLAFRELIDLPRQGRFIQIDEDRFVALTRELADRLDALDGLGAARGQGLKISPALLPLVDELTRAAGDRELDGATDARLARLLDLADRRFDVPRAFAGELRDYQRDGFQWMMRLAEAGLGAVLADDMGLGKTVQALALMVARAERGPALVVAPASVATNWADEARRFAPTLRMRALESVGRAETIAGLGPRDVLVCTYGLLVSEADRLAEVAFDTVVLDEAHYLKNPRTKRARSAHRLQASFRLGLTGTPIENHVGELWSLMRATVPGLLGPQRRFEQRYASLAEHEGRARAQHLKAILRPFLLRRTKAQVLDELPPRTEVTLRVTPTDDERAFYEALRRQALARLDVPGSASRMQVLAEIMRLRQAAIDPRLVDPDAGPAGAKLDALIDRLLSLREEGHRALVFTQFLGSLARVGEGLDEAGLTYLTLEGSTPTKQRAKLIEEFQRGETDVFVMSLKAGGIGVNLTAADYVIHVDPWWNPAVEDQATGRAHRIGQSRPVTVYRLITEGTIEEKILALHRDKRALADDLLSGMESAAALDLDQLRGLLEP